MKRTLNIALMLLGLPMAVFLSSPTRLLAQDAPPACTDIESLPDGSQVQPIIGEFLYQNHSYSFLARSAWAQSPWDRSMMCFRYEIQNNGTEKIEEVRWKMGRIGFADLEIGDPPIVIVFQEPTEYETAELVPTSIEAFIDSSQTGQSFVTTERKQEQKQEQKKKAGAEWHLVSLRPDEVLSGDILLNLTSAAIEAQPFLAFVPNSKDKIQLPAIEMSASSPAGGVTFDSFAGGLGSFAITVKRYPPDGGPSVTLYDPLSDAIDLTLTSGEFRPERIPDAIRFLANKSFKPHTLDRLEARDLTTSVGGLDVAPVFLVHHPVTLVSDTREACVLVTSYSPIPLSLGDDLCVHSKKWNCLKLSNSIT